MTQSLNRAVSRVISVRGVNFPNLHKKLMPFELIFCKNQCRLHGFFAKIDAANRMWGAQRTGKIDPSSPEDIKDSTTTKNKKRPHNRRRSTHVSISSMTQH